MRDYITIGPTPSEESCFPIGHPLALAETHIYCSQLRHEFPGAVLRVKAFHHDFGVYHEVCAYYDDVDEQSINMAYKVESDAPPKWDKAARKELEALKVAT